MIYTTNDGTEIKDCPFCGNSWGPPQTEQHTDGGRWNVSCMNAQCGGSSGYCDSEAEATALWNTRPKEEAK